MPQVIHKGVKQLLSEANNQIGTLIAENAQKSVHSDKALFIDVRDKDERDREGIIPGSIHIPRGILEFKIDPETPVHDPIFTQDKQFIFYCTIGWRSALSAKTAADMGLSSVFSLEGGMSRWKEVGGRVTGGEAD